MWQSYIDEAIAVIEAIDDEFKSRSPIDKP